MSSVASVRARRRARPLLDRGNVRHPLLLPFAQPSGETLGPRRRQHPAWAPSFFPSRVPSPRRLLATADVEHLPPLVLHSSSRALEAIEHAGAALVRCDAGDDARDSIHVIVVPRFEQTPADQVVDATLIRRKVLGGAHGCRNDGVMVTHTSVVHEPPPQGALTGAGREQMPITRILDRVHHGAQRLGDRGGEMSAVRTRIADQLLLFV